MKILIISNMYPSHKDPTYGTFVKSFTDSIIEYNLDGKTTLIAIKGRSNSKAIKFFKYISFYIRLLFRLLFGIYDIIYVHTITFPIIPIRLVSLIKNLHLVFNVHGGDVLNKTKLAHYLRQIATPLLDKALAVVVPSPFFSDIIKREFPLLNSNKIIISPSAGISDTFFFNRNLQTTDHWKTRTLRIGYVSRVDKGKGWSTLLSAFEHIIDKIPNLSLTIAGRGSEQGELIKTIEKSKGSNQILYLGGVPHLELPNLYKQFDVFIFPTELEESLGLVAIEAMASGCPIIASNIGAIPNYIKDTCNGFLFEAGNSQDLSNQIERFFRMSISEYNLMSQEAYNTATNYRTPIVMKDLYEKLNQLK